MVFKKNTDGKTLYPMKPHLLFPDENKIFKNGTGWYYDYYYETKSIKVLGHYKNGKKDGIWIYYDEKKNEILREYYSNGVLISEQIYLV